EGRHLSRGDIGVEIYSHDVDWWHRLFSVVKIEIGFPFTYGYPSVYAHASGGIAQCICPLSDVLFSGPEYFAK
ncbi:MAG: hypothetical protein KDD06_30080, partial [Phaeodactylibacter sp.]|nr:hypothetical protein [Phaeodactylibacter sp.]